ncbi:MAG: DUF192 domain-containing protein [Hyphomicrobium sp.]
MLFVSTLFALPSGPVDAKIRVERLWIVTANGREIPFDTEIAEDQKEKALGLMFRTELADDRGMLFPYEDSREMSMWMHNTYIPLDMLFIRSDGVIHRIESRAEPMSDRVINSEGPVAAVLELAGGAAERLGIKAGDRVRHPIFGAERP